MSNDTLEIKAALMMGKPVHEVFEAIVDPSKMSNTAGRVIVLLLNTSSRNLILVLV